MRLEMTDKIREQVVALAAMGGACVHDFDQEGLDEDNFPNTKEGWEQFQDARMAAYNALSDDDKARYFNVVLAMLGQDFDDQDEEKVFPYCRSSCESNSFRQTVFATARQKYPLVYLALRFAKQCSKLRYSIDNLLAEREDLDS